MVEIPVPTISGLCLFLGFADRGSFYDMEKLPNFTYTIKRARLSIEMTYEELLHTATPTGAIFALKNFGWYDNIGIDHNMSDNVIEKFATLSNADLLKAINELNSGKNK